ncbi:AI-2E family transporter [Floricoccus tropicus]|uniref:AI-2E family transporter n=1 Tax=Floricoccus tropicus TaxID=1859473 RepID=A0A1E8GQ69_9LACT|nr:AI-2E family transporter [Floricoccus tropicus]OFI50392.1 AI-2E family transporter [Floricoccus tropicus]
MNQNRPYKTSWFYKLFINNRIATTLVVSLLLFLNLFIISKLGFLFRPIIEFLGIIMLPVVLAAIFYYMLNPIVDWCEKKGIKRTISISILFIILVGIIIFSLAVVIPSIFDHIESFMTNIPYYISESQKRINEIIKQPLFEQFRPQIEEFINNVSGKLIEASRDISKTAVSGVTGFLSTATSVLVSIAILPFILFYLLKDGRRLNPYVTQFLPDKVRPQTAKILSDVGNTLSNYVRGQVTVSLAVAIMLSTLFTIIGLKYSVTIGIIAGVLNLIPYLGSFVALVTALLVALATGPVMIIKVLICFALEQFIEAHLISPLVLGSKLKIHPVTVLIVLLTSGKLFGLWGVLLGIPVYASLKVIISYFYKWYREVSGLYSEPLMTEGQLDQVEDELDKEAEE